eukprot:m51a1_g6645 hypothetical protein (336) ;mRNA; f:116826-118003
MIADMRGAPAPAVQQAKISREQYEREARYETRTQLRNLLRAIDENPQLASRAVLYRRDSFATESRALCLSFGLSASFVALALVSLAVVASGDRDAAARSFSRAAAETFCTHVYERASLITLIGYIVACFGVWITSVTLYDRRRGLLAQVTAAEAAFQSVVDAVLPLLLRAGFVGIVLFVSVWVSGECKSSFERLFDTCRQAGPVWEVASSSSVILFSPAVAVGLPRAVGAVLGLLSLTHLVMTVFETMTLAAFGNLTEICLCVGWFLFGALLWASGVSNYGVYIVLAILVCNTMKLAWTISKHIEARPEEPNLPDLSRTIPDDDDDAGRRAPAAH